MNQSKYRNVQLRATWWDYGKAAAYYITICTHNRENYFGDIIDGKMVLSPIGKIADSLWYEIKNHAKNVSLNEFVIMPNHIHGILVITQNDDFNQKTDGIENINSVDIRDADTTHAFYLHHEYHEITGFEFDKNDSFNYRSRFQNQGKNTLSSIIGSYKSAVSKHAHQKGCVFKWQSRFYDHIIRNETEFIFIEAYIQNNPSKWHEDKLNNKTYR